MRKLAIFAKSLGGGGTEVALTNLLNRIDSNKYDITLYLLDKNEEYKYRLHKEVKVEYIEFKFNFLHNFVSNEKLLGKILKKLSINKYIPYYKFLSRYVSNKFEKFDVVIDFYGYGYFLTEFVANEIQAPSKSTWLHDENFYWLKSVSKSLKYYQNIFCVSQALKDKFDAQYKEYTFQTRVFYNVIDIEWIKNQAKVEIPTEFSQDEPTLVSVGRLHNQKGFDIALDAAKILVQDYKRSFKWLIIGDGPEKKSLLQKVNELGLEEVVYFLGRKDNPYPYIGNADLYVQPSRHEGFGITVLEAKVLKRTVVASDLLPFREQIKDGVNGFIVSLNPQDLAKKIDEIVGNPDIHSTLKIEEISFDEEMEKLYSL